MSTGERLAVVAYAFYPRHARHLAHTLARFMADEPARVLWVHAAGAGAPVGLPAHARMQALACDGQGWEFAAYQQGLDALRASGWAGAIAFFNDTAGRHYPLGPAELRALRQFALAPDAAHPVLAGHVEPAPAGFAWRGQALPAWVRSNAFALSPAALAALDQRLFDADEFASPAWQRGTLALPEHLSPALREHLQRWLMAPGPQGWRHHAGRPQPAPELLLSKAGSILLEKRLSARVLAAGGHLQHCGRQGALQKLAERAFFARRKLGRWRAEVAA